jgi:uncharacterized membrane protein YphA (DoxX/SURF4 family)
MPFVNRLFWATLFKYMHVCKKPVAFSLKVKYIYTYQLSKPGRRVNMNLIHRIEKWGDSHHPKFLDIIRVALGIFLFLKGLGFMENSASLKVMIENQPDISLSSAWLMAAVYYVTFVHFAGGVLIMLGIFTRLSAIIQLPVVFCAVIFINYLQSPFNTDLISSVAAFVLLVVFAVIGSGKWSVESYLESFSEQG